MGWLAKLFPGPAILTKIAVYVLVFALGGAIGNSWATKRALERELQASADRMRENHLALFEEFRRRNAEYKAHIEQQEGAAAAAYAVLEQGKAQSDQAVARARRELAAAHAQIAKASETIDGLKNVTTILAAQPQDPGCVMSERVRGVLDTAIAAINHYPAASGNPETPASAVSAGAGGAPAVLTCSELERGFLDVLGAYGRLKARVIATGAWAQEALR